MRPALGKCHPNSVIQSLFQSRNLMAFSTLPALSSLVGPLETLGLADDTFASFEKNGPFKATSSAAGKPANNWGFPLQWGRSHELGCAASECSDPSSTSSCSPSTTCSPSLMPSSNMPSSGTCSAIPSSWEASDSSSFTATSFQLSGGSDKKACAPIPLPQPKLLHGKASTGPHTPDGTRTTASATLTIHTLADPDSAQHGARRRSGLGWLWHRKHTPQHQRPASLPLHQLPLAPVGTCATTTTTSLPSPSLNLPPRPWLSPEGRTKAEEMLPQMLGPQGRFASLKNEQGRKLAVYLWPAACSVSANDAGRDSQGSSQPLTDDPLTSGDSGSSATGNSARPKGTIVLVHGHGAYAGWEWLLHAAPVTSGLDMNGSIATDTCNVSDGAERSSSSVPNSSASASGSSSSVKDELSVRVQGSARYEDSWVQALNTAGFSVAALDLQGMGRSEGPRCYVQRFSHYCSDVCLLLGALSRGVSQLPGFAAGQPLFMMGSSLGGAVTTHLCHQLARERHLGKKDTPEIRGAVLLAPMLNLGAVSSSPVNKVLRHVAHVLNALWPHAAIVSGARGTRLPDVQQSWDEDPLTSKCKGTRIRNALEYLHACAQLQSDLTRDGGFSTPALVFHSESDMWTDSQGSINLARSARGEVELHILPGDMHSLSKGKDSTAIRERVLSWLCAHATS